MTDPGREKYSESTLRLSERYGIDPARLDAILGKPREDVGQGAEHSATFEDQRIHQPNIAQQIPRAEPVMTSAPASTNIHTPPKDVRSTGSTLSNGPRASKTYTYEKQVSPVTWIIALLVLGGLAAMIYFARGCNNEASNQPQSPGSTFIVDTVIKTDTLATTDTVTIPTPEAPAAAPARRRATARRSTASASRNVALSTTSSFSAQERLAELKADGYTKANIRRVTKNGVTLYQVRTKK